MAADCSMTVLQKVYHRTLGENPTLIETNHSTRLQSAEQVYQRKVAYTEEWKLLDVGWFDRETAGTIIIQNPKPFRPTLPSQEETAADRKRVLEVSYSQNSEEAFEIAPGDSLRVTATNAPKLYVRARTGTVQGIVSILPR